MLGRPALVLLALAALTSCDEPAHLASKPTKPTLSEASFRLPNGLDVELVRGPCGESSAVVVLFEVGADHDPPGRSGMADLVARVWSVQAASEERIVTTGRDHTLYSVVAAGEELAAELDQVAAWMSGLELTEAELDRARSEVLAEIARRRGGDPAKMAESYAAESVQPSRGSGWRGGIAEEVQAIEMADVQGHWQAHYKPENARLIVVGDFDAGDVRSRIERAFARVPSGTAPAPRDPANATVTGTLVMGDAPAAVAIAVPAPAPSEPLYPAFLVLAARLLRESTEPRAWVASYDPVHLPETLFVTGPREPVEQPEAAAAAIRGQMTAALAGPLAPSDLAETRERFGLLLGVHDRDPRSCRSDVRTLALARTRRAQLGLVELPLAEQLEAISDEQLEEATALFGPRRTAAVIAGGTIR